MIKQVDRFTVATESGRKLTVNVFQEFTKFEPLNGPSQLVPGLKSVRLDDGSPVNFIDDNTFKLVLTDEIVRKV